MASQLKTENMFDLLDNQEINENENDGVCVILEKHFELPATEMPELPSNRGFICGGLKHYGQQQAVDKCENVELVDLDNCQVHRFARKSHAVFSLERDFISSTQMVPCPEELNGRFCSQRGEKTHRLHHYHFATQEHGRYVQGKLVCRYSRTDPNNLCWERHNAQHAKIFIHVE